MMIMRPMCLAILGFGIVGYAQGVGSPSTTETKVYISGSAIAEGTIRKVTHKDGESTTFDVHSVRVLKVYQARGTLYERYLIVVQREVRVKNQDDPGSAQRFRERTWVFPTDSIKSIEFVEEGTIQQPKE